MKVINGYRQFNPINKPLVATIGNFDGIHAGHRVILDKVIKRAKELNGYSLVYTFQPHPIKVIAPAKELNLICSYETKLKRLEALKIDFTIVEPFTNEFARITAPQFINEILLNKIKVTEIFVGHDFTFGKGREGTPEKLQQIGSEAGLKVTIIPPVKISGEIVSSSLIRKRLLEGDVAKAAEYLSIPHEIHGTIVNGKQRGIKLGFPTANIETTDGLIPKPGVYITKTEHKKTSCNSITNIGFRPTFQQNKPKQIIETYLLDFKEDLYNKEITISFLQRIRDEIRFETVEKLKEQIKDDVRVTMEYFMRKSLR